MESDSITTIGCGQPLHQYPLDNTVWAKIKVGPYVGHIFKSKLSQNKPVCHQDKYPKFFEKMNLSLSDMYYWGRLYDKYVQGQSEVK